MHAMAVCCVLYCTRRPRSVGRKESGSISNRDLSSDTWHLYIRPSSGGHKYGKQLPYYSSPLLKTWSVSSYNTLPKLSFRSVSGVAYQRGPFAALQPVTTLFPWELADASCMDWRAIRSSMKVQNNVNRVLNAISSNDSFSSDPVVVQSQTTTIGGSSAAESIDSCPIKGPLFYTDFCLRLALHSQCQEVWSAGV
jgi:hypothetical protein